MDPKPKIVLAVIAGMLGGMFLLGSALAIPAALHFVGRQVAFDDGYGMMGPQGGMMGRGEIREWNDGSVGCPNIGEPGVAPMRPRGDVSRNGCVSAPQFDGGVCPNRDATGAAL